MSYDFVFAQISDIIESDKSINPISTPFVSSHTLMANDERRNNGDNEPDRLPSLCGRLDYENVDNKRDRIHPLKERLAPERTPAPSYIHIPAHPGTFYFRNGIIAMLP